MSGNMEQKQDAINPNIKYTDNTMYRLDPFATSLTAKSPSKV